MTVPQDQNNWNDWIEQQSMQVRLEREADRQERFEEHEPTESEQVIEGDGDT